MCPVDSLNTSIHFMSNLFEAKFFHEEDFYLNSKVAGWKCEANLFIRSLQLYFISKLYLFSVPSRSDEVFTNFLAALCITLGFVAGGE